MSEITLGGLTVGLVRVHDDFQAHQDPAIAYGALQRLVVDYLDNIPSGVLHPWERRNLNILLERVGLPRASLGATHAAL